MNKILLIIQREYLSRVKKKSFIIMTILGPILMAAVYIVPVWLAMRDKETTQIIEVIDESKFFIDTLPQSKAIKFVYSDITLEKALPALNETEYAAILYIPSNILDSKSVKLFYSSQPGIEIESHIRNSIEEIIYNDKLRANNIDINIIKNSQTTIKVLTEKLKDDGSSQRTNSGLLMIVGLAGGILIYMFIFVYGVQVMRGVIEEKTNRIVEVIISSVKPFQLMMGKIVGIALVGLTQFLLWIVLTLGLSAIVQGVLLKDVNQEIAQQNLAFEEVKTKGADLKALSQPIPRTQNSEVYEMISTLNSIDFKTIALCFIFYFLGGYLLYSALFAAIGAAVDSETDTQQFMLPVSIPLILSFIVSQSIIRDPNSSLAFWMSIIPFTSPITMMVRLPFGVPMTDILISMGLLIVGFVFTVWLAGRIYRTGILMYGKKPSYKEMWKWLFYKG